MLWSWNAPARADIKQDGINYPRLSRRDLEWLNYLRQADKTAFFNLGNAGRYFCAATAAAVSVGVAFAFNHYAEKPIGVRNVAAVVALGLGVCAVRSDLKNARLINREIKFKELGENNAQKLFKPLGDFSCSVSGLETALTDAFRLMEFHINEGGGQPYNDSFNAKARKKAECISVGQFGQDLRADSQIQRFVNCLKLAQTLSDDHPDKQSALDKCNQLIIQPGFVQKLARYVVSDSGHKLITNSDYKIHLKDEMYNLCRMPLVTLAVINKNNYIRCTMDEYHSHTGWKGLPSILHGAIVLRCAEIDKDLAPRLKDEIGIDIIGRILQQLPYSHSYFDGILSNDEVAAISKWSGDDRDPLAEEIDALPASPPVMPAINPASNPQSRGGR